MSFSSIQGQVNIQGQQSQLVLREGQVFHGSIKQLYPGQTAEVQVGANKLVAKLEIPLKAGDAHYFQVTSTSGQVELKVVTGPMSQAMNSQQQMNQLLDTMNLSKTAEMRGVLAHLLKNDLPIARDQLIQAESWMKSLPNQVTKEVALQAIGRMLESKMPFTNDVFQALIHGSKPTGMNGALTNLMQQLTQDQSINVNAKKTIIQQLQTIEKPLQAEVGGNILAKIVQTLTDTSAPATNKMQMLNVLKNAGIIGPNATLANWSTSQTTSHLVANQMINAGQLLSHISNSQPQQISQLIQDVKQWVAQEPTLTTDQKMQMQQLADRLAQLPPSKQVLDVFGKQMNEQLQKAFSQNQLTQPSLQNEQGMTPKDQLFSLIKPDQTQFNASFRQLAQMASQSNMAFIQATTAEAEQLVQSNLDGRSMEQAMKTVMRGLGLNYEAMLATAKGDQIDALAQTLKPQLLNLLQDAQISPALRDSAEVVLARLNGMQLLSTENGHQQQLVMQVPLEFLGKKMDATLQWNGRMKDDGKIDANYARVLFYLQMEALQETVIDMQVQNRIVTVTVFNENTRLDRLAEPLKAVLKKALAEKDYHLSGVFMKTFEKDIQPIQKEPTNDGYDGVDIRI